MKTFRLVALLLSVFLAAAVSAAPADDGKKCVEVKNLNEENLVFKGGEKLIFEVHYKWGIINADVAKATVKVDTATLNGKKVFHASIYGKTQKMYNSFFRVSENLQSWFTRDGLKPMQFTRTAREGGYTCTNHYTYVRTPGNEHIAATLNNSRKGDFSTNLKIDDCTMDIPAMFFMLRNIDMSKLKAGSRYPMTFAVDDDVYTLHFIFEGRENKEVPGVGTIKCLKFGFQVVEGEVFSGDSDLFCWFSDDANRIPVWFVAPLKIGRVQGRLEQYSGLKYPFTAKSK